MKSILQKDLISCLLCHDPLCTKGCNKGLDPGRILRSLKFKNHIGAMNILNDSCINCDASCENNCIIPHEVKIKSILSNCYNKKINSNYEYKRNSLNIKFCGITLENPFLLSSSVVSSNYDMIKRAFNAGWAGASIKTISLIDMEEASPRYSVVKGIDGEIEAFKNIEQLSEKSLEENLLMIKRLKKEFPNKFLLMSIMGKNEDEWKYLGKCVEDSGASAIELNFSCPNMTEEYTGSDIGQIPDLVFKYTKAVTSSVKIPVIAKLTPNVATMCDAAISAKRAGAKGIAAINTIKSLTEYDVINDINSNKHITVGGLSGRAVMPIALRFISELSHNLELSDIDISGMGGIYTYKDAINYLSLGCRSLQVTTAVMEYGYRIIDDLIDGLELYLGYNNISLNELIGCSKNKVVNLKQIKRDYIIYPKFNRLTCVKCNRCYISCSDGGHQAIELVNRIPTLNSNKCVGCHLCVNICPTGSITSSEIEVKKKL